MRVKRYLSIIGRLGLLLFFINFAFFYYWSNRISKNHEMGQFFKDYLTTDFKLSNLSNAIPFKCSDYISLVVVVPCELKDVSQRTAIRNTWGQWLSLKYSLNISVSIRSITYHTNQAKLLFVVGSKTANLNDVENDLKFLQKESHFDDIIFLPELLDSYMNLTLKMLVGLGIARQKCFQAIYFLKADTDVFLNVPHLMTLCQEYYSFSKSKALIMGTKQTRSHVIRSKASKWYVPLEIYPSNFYPSYALGSGYLLNSKAVDQIINAASRVKRLFFWEDVAITGLYATNVEIINNPLFRGEDFMKFVDSCHMEILVVVHRITPEKMISIWNDLNSKTAQCTIVSYLFNPLREYKYRLKALFW